MSKVKSKRVFIVLIFIYCYSFGQRETENWYFGEKAGINFIDRKPNILNDGELTTPKGSATISDKNGNLLFYTDGVFVFNKNHIGMEDGLLIASDKEVLQSSIIIPKPNEPSIYYLFTIKNTNDVPILGEPIEPGLYYSIIDLSYNGGLGKVTKKNIALNSLASEKLSAVHSKDGKSFWVVSFGKENEAIEYFDTIYSYKVSSNGINTFPTISKMPYGAIANKGALKISPNGSYISFCNYTNVVLANFNSEDGSVTSFKYLDIRRGINPSKPSPFAFGIEFSQDSKYFYVESIFYPTGNYSIFQYATDNPEEDRQEVISFDSIGAYANGNYMQLASDGNIYVTTSISNDEDGNYLSQIIPPKSYNNTIASFRENTIDLNEGKSRLGLPNFIQSYFRTRIVSDDNCINNNVVFEVDSYATITAAEWNFGDGVTSQDISPNHVYTSSGQYLVNATITVNDRQINVSKFITIHSPPQVNNNQKIIQCDLDNNGIDNFNLTTISDEITFFGSREEIYYYEKYSDITDNTPIANPENYTNTSNPQTIYAKVINDNGCFSIAEFTIESIFVELDDISDMYACAINDETNNGSFDLDLKKNEIRNSLGIPSTTILRFYPDTNSAQTNINELRRNFISPSTTIWVRADTSQGCGGIEPISLIVNSKLKIDLQNSYTICYNPSEKPPVIISADSSNERYEWRNNLNEIISINQDFTLDTLGEFSLTVYKSENGLLCSTTKAFVVENPEKPIFQNIDVNTEDSQNNIVQVILDGNSTYEFSLDNINFSGNATSYTFNNVVSGLRTIYVRDRNNCEESIQTKVTVIGFKKFFTPDGDGNNDYWNIKGINPDEFKSINILIFDRFGMPIREIKDFEDEGWDGTFNGKLLAPSSFWYKAKIVDIDNNLIEESGNFSLIRI